MSMLYFLVATPLIKLISGLGRPYKSYTHTEACDLEPYRLAVFATGTGRVHTQSPSTIGA